MNFPTLVYRTPGTHQCAGGTYDCIGANSQDHLESLFVDGWFLSLPDAISGEHSVPSPEPEPQASPKTTEEIVRQWLSDRATHIGIEHGDDLDELQLLLLICSAYKPVTDEDADDPEEDNSEPTRAELEAKAKELEIAFDGRTTDRILAEKIAAALAEQE